MRRTHHRFEGRDGDGRDYRGNINDGCCNNGVPIYRRSENKGYLSQLELKDLTPYRELFVQSIELDVYLNNAYLCCEFPVRYIPVIRIDEVHFRVADDVLERNFRFKFDSNELPDTNYQDTEPPNEEVTTLDDEEYVDDEDEKVGIISPCHSRLSVFVSRSEHSQHESIIKPEVKKLISSVSGTSGITPSILPPILPTEVPKIVEEIQPKPMTPAMIVDNISFEERITKMNKFLKSPGLKSDVNADVLSMLNKYFMEGSGLNLCDDPTNSEEYNGLIYRISDYLIGITKSQLDAFITPTGEPRVRETDSIIENDVAGVSMPSIASSANAEVIRELLSGSQPIGIENPELRTHIESKRVPIIDEDDEPVYTSLFVRPGITRVVQRPTLVRDDVSIISSLSSSNVMGIKDAMAAVYLEILSEVDKNHEILQSRCFEIAYSRYPDPFHKWVDKSGKFTRGGYGQCGRLIKNGIGRKAKFENRDGDCRILKIPPTKSEFIQLFK
jgi:hypothetical protein